MYPQELVLIRHGQAEGNKFRHELKRNLHGLPEEFKRRPDLFYRLTDLGREQARQAGLWIRQNIAGDFDRCFYSPLIRALETAGELGLANANWEQSIYLIESLTGLEQLAADKFLDFQEDAAQYALAPLTWIPPRGEPLYKTCIQVNHFVHEILMDFAGRRAICVCHEKVIWAFRFLLEHLNPMELKEKMDRQPILNGSIVHYTRINPANGQETNEEFSWVRLICPHNTDKSHDWEKINGNSYNSQELLSIARNITQLIS